MRQDPALTLLGAGTQNAAEALDQLAGDDLVLPA
jgi:hypothetical protein